MAGPWQDRYIAVDGVRTHYLEAGTGEPIVLVHGGLVWCCGELTYGAVIDPLAGHFRVIAVDVPGFGETPARAPEHYTARGQGDFLVRFVRALGAPVHLAGNSHGGWLVQYIAHEAPEMVRRLVIINSLNGTSPIPDDYPLPRDTDLEPTPARVRENLRAFYANTAVVTDERVRRTHEVSSRNFAVARARRAVLGSTPAEWNRHLLYRGVHISEHAGRLPVPVLMTWSRENPGASPADATVFLGRLRDGELHVWTGAGHHVMTEYPEGWTAVVTGFLRSTR
ncbi:MAG: alpha/beta hydrolase [Armatimonadota bacterium]|nr:alpha/beta hydrolase [Armatimonadota bacterium]